MTRSAFSLSENPIIWLIDWWLFVRNMKFGEPNLTTSLGLGGLFYYLHDPGLSIEKQCYQRKWKTHILPFLLFCCRSNRVVSLRILEVVVFPKKEVSLYPSCTIGDKKFLGNMWKLLAFDIRYRTIFQKWSAQGLVF